MLVSQEESYIFNVCGLWCMTRKASKHLKPLVYKGFLRLISPDYVQVMFFGLTFELRDTADDF